jgi:hypothetical protein
MKTLEVRPAIVAGLVLLVTFAARAQEPAPAPEHAPAEAVQPLAPAENPAQGAAPATPAAPEPQPTPVAAPTPEPVPSPVAPAATTPTLAVEAQPLRDGSVAGEVRASDGSPVAGAAVYPEGVPIDATTDARGRFALTLPSGSHRLTVIHGNYRTGTAMVEVASDKSATVRVVLAEAQRDADDFIVTAAFIQGGVASLLEQRRNRAAVSDAVSAEDIARMPTSNAAGAAQRVVGANIVDGRFVYVRGLGERYTNALLNGMPLPSPEPDRSTVPLDLFPAQILESLDISKTFTPDVPGDFAGGSVRIVTRKVPEKPMFSVSLSSSLNSESTFVEGYGQRAGSTDSLGFDDGDRQLSEEVPRDYALSLGARKPDGEQVLSEELEAQGQNLNSTMSVERDTNLPNVSASAAAGNGWRLGNGMRFGALGSLTYSHVQSSRPDATSELEMDSDNTKTDEPRTHITATDVTLCGTGETGTAPSNGMVLRENVTGAFENITVTGFDVGADVRDAFGTEADPSVTLAGSLFWGQNTSDVGGDEPDMPDATTNPNNDMGFVENDWFEMGEGNEIPDPAPYDVEACQEAEGPSEDVTGSDTGAFTGEADWMQGLWVSWVTE